MLPFRESLKILIFLLYLNLFLFLNILPDCMPKIIVQGLSNVESLKFKLFYEKNINPFKGEIIKLSI